MAHEIDKLIANIDQAGEMIKLYAPLVHGFFEALVKQGFTRDEAMSLTAIYLESLARRWQNN